MPEGDPERHAFPLGTPQILLTDGRIPKSANMHGARREIDKAPHLTAHQNPLFCSPPVVSPEPKVTRHKPHYHYYHYHDYYYIL